MCRYLITLYSAVKLLHVVSASVGLAGFVLRAALRFAGRPRCGQGWRYWLPHANDSILLCAGVALVVLTAQYPFRDAWLTAKLFGVLCYIALGAIALKDGRLTRWHFAALFAALATYLYVVAVALSKNPLGCLLGRTGA